MDRRSIVVVVSAALGCASGCAHESASTTSTSSSEWRPSTRELYVRDRLPDACDGERVRTVTFEAGSNDVGENDDLALDRLARCLEARPYEKEKIVVVGADHARAESVRQALVEHGVAARRIRIDEVGRDKAHVNIVLVGSGGRRR